MPPAIHKIIKNTKSYKLNIIIVVILKTNSNSLFVMNWKEKNLKSSRELKSIKHKQSKKRISKEKILLP